jgi:hypothetical protein
MASNRPRTVDEAKLPANIKTATNAIKSRLAIDTGCFFHSSQTTSRHGSAIQPPRDWLAHEA